MSSADLTKHCLEHAQQIAEHGRRLDRVDVRLENHDRALYGQNSSNLGIVARIANVETVIAQQRQTRAWLIGLIVATAVNLGTALFGLLT
jgi:hypothetical protein